MRAVGGRKRREGGKAGGNPPGVCRGGRGQAGVLPVKKPSARRNSAIRPVQWYQQRAIVSTRDGGHFL
jgi:hypothetical protein